jgi:hypothetical protein
MSDIVYCAACGQRMEPEGRFCSACGAAAAEPAAPAAPTNAGPTAPQAEPVAASTTVAATAPPPPPPPPPAPAADAQSAARPLGGDASDFAGMLVRFVRSPGVLTASLAAAIGAGVTFVFGLLVAIVFTVNGSVIGSALGFDEDGSPAGIVTRAFRQTAATLLVPFDLPGASVSARPVPSLFLLVPLAAIAVAMAQQGRRLRHLPARERLAWGALTGVPFALLMLIPLLMSGDLAPSFGWTLLASLGWAALAGTAGAWWAIRRDAPETLHGLVPSRATEAGRVVRTALAPLAVVLVATTLIGTGVWIVQTLRGVEGLREQRSTIAATIENALYAPAHGIHFAELGALTAFRMPVPVAGELALPVTKVAELADVSDLEDLTEETPGTYRLFDYHRPLPAWAFLLIAALLLAIPGLLAVYAGFALARSRGARTLPHGAAWGVLVGPAWALTMVVLSTLLASNPFYYGELFGQADGGSVFVMFLLGGGALGALGGVLGTAGAIGGSGSPQEATDA